MNTKPHKPQIIMQALDTEGRHNAGTRETRKRLIKEGAWKRQRTVVLIPAGTSIPAKVYLTHWNLAFAPNNGVAKILAYNVEVGEAYSQSIEQVINHPELGTWEYLLTIEHDNMPPPFGLLRLLERMESNPQFAAISGAYYTKGYGGVLQAWGDPRDPLPNFRPQPPSPNGGLVECCGIGMGFALWRLPMFKDKRLRRPWFVTQKDNGVATQDLYAWSDFRKHGYRCAVDCSVKVGHYCAEEDIVW